MRDYVGRQLGPTVQISVQIASVGGSPQVGEI